MRPDPAALFGSFDFKSYNCVIAAVSGGSDSIALVVLLDTHLRSLGTACRLVAVTVDHALRPESADEAAFVSRFCASRGIAHRIVRWSDDKPSTGMADAARQARYRLLADAAEAAGASIVFTGHTMDDQAETVAMRLRRGGNPSLGLSAMAPLTLYDEHLWIARPLIGTRRAALREMLGQAGIGWVDDPSNENLAYERARTRAELTEAGSQEVERLALLAHEAGAARRNLAVRAAALLDRYASRAAAGLVHLLPDFARAEDREAALHALRALLACIGGRNRLPERAASDELLARLSQIGVRATLSRGLVDVRRSGIWLLREGRGLPAASRATPEHLWDGRFRIRANSPSEVEIAPCAHRTCDDAVPHPTDSPTAPEALLRQAMAAQPVFRVGGRVLCCGDVSSAEAGIDCVPVLAPFARFMAVYDLRLVRALAVIFAAGDPLAPPSGNHIGDYD